MGNSDMNNSVAEILSRLMQQQDVSEYALARVTGVPQPTIHRILTGESSDPRTGSLRPIATYFGVSVAQLRGDEPLQGLPVPGQSCSSAEQEFISQFRQLNEEERRVILRAVTALVQSRATSGTT
jgi:transcriptional regulator with XRE-family HTH domain